MSIRDVINEYTRWQPSFRSLPTVSKTERIRHKIEEMLSPITAITLGVDLEKIHQKLTKQQWESIESREWKFTPECLSMGEKPLVYDESFVATYLAALRYHGSSMVFRRLVWYYLRDYEPKRPSFHRIGDFLSTHVAKCGLWGERHARYRIFDAPNAFRTLCVEIMRSENGPRTFIEEIGFKGTLTSSKLVAEAFVYACDNVRSAIPRASDPLPSLQKIVGWAVINQSFAYEGARDAKKALGDVMLLPWVSRTPSDPVREWVFEWMLRLFKDPRIEPHNWMRISEDAKGVMFRWLTKASFDQFFEVVGEVVSHNSKHQWDARKKFWLAYYERQHLQEAWIVFDKHGETIAKRVGNMGYGRFGRSSRGQSVLIMRIGSLIIVEWSHNGACRIWRDGENDVPTLYGPEYSKKALMTNSLYDKSHMGKWQTDVHDFIASETNIRLDYRDYMI